MRTAHYLRPNKRQEMPNHMIFVDTETKSVKVSDSSVKAELWFGNACYTRKLKDDKWSEPQWLRFETQAEFWDFVFTKVKKKKTVYLYAHNIAFDAVVLGTFKILRETGWELKKAILDDPPSILRFVKDGSSLIWVDTLNYFRMPLKELGSWLGTPKYDMPLESDPLDKWDAYCRQDVQVIRQAILKWLEILRSWNLGNYQLTLASQALTAYRHRFMDSPIYIDDNEQALKLSREAYSGGRVEAFRLGVIDEPVWMVDVNSLYPYVMTHYQYPNKLKGYYSRVSVKELIKDVRRYAVVATVKVRTDIPTYPYKLKGRLVFPVGTFWTTLTTPDLDYAVSVDEILEVKNEAVYEEAPLFNSYVEYFYNNKVTALNSGDRTLGTIAKLFLNSLYGKFGQSGKIWDEVKIDYEPPAMTWLDVKPSTGERHNYRVLNGLVQELSAKTESIDSLPIIAAHVTAHGRRVIWRMLLDAGRENVFYMDTDSLILNEAGLAKLQRHLSDDRLGGLKIAAYGESLIIEGLKDYRIGKILKRKGIRKNAELIAPNTYRQDKFRGFKGMIKDSDLDSVLISRVTKTLNHQYHKGLVTPSGMIEPFRLDC